jgi:hypothetical protein
MWEKLWVWIYNNQLSLLDELPLLILAIVLAAVATTFLRYLFESL